MAAYLTIHTERFPQLYYRKYGKGPAIVLLHGFPADGELWFKIWEQLAEQCLVIVPDLPGSGKSSFTGDDVSIDELAGSVNAILEHENINEAVIVGHSMGGYTALAFADLYAPKLKGLALVHSTSAADNEEKIATRKKSIDLIRKGGKEPFIKQMVPNLFSKTFSEANQTVIEDRVNKGLKLEAASMIAFYNSMIERPDRTEVLKNGHFPVLWVLGQDDNVIPYKPVLKQTTLANVNFISIYSDSGHMSMLEQDKQLIDDLQKFAAYCYSKSHT